MRTVPWPQLLLALWPLWVAYAVLVVVGIAGWVARRG